MLSINIVQNHKYCNTFCGRNDIYLPNGASPKRILAYVHNCALCGKRIPKDKRSFDHFLPKTLGGKTEFKNGIVTCQDCNWLKKGNKHPGRLFDENPEMEGHLKAYLELEEVKKIVLPKAGKGNGDVYYADVLKQHIEQILGRSLFDNFKKAKKKPL